MASSRVVAARPRPPADNPVPSLNLPRDTDDDVYEPSAAWDINLRTPATGSTVSWGPSAGRAPLPAPHAKPSQGVQSGRSWRSEQPITPTCQQTTTTTNGGQQQQQQQQQLVWVNTNRAHLHSLHDPDEERYWKKRHDIFETILVDQLSRAVLCDPRQDSTRTAAAGHTARPPSGATWGKGSNQALHRTLVKTDHTATEAMLQSRVQFDARVVSRHAVALREVSGIFFQHDSSLVVYELREFGKQRYSSLPFIERGAYLNPYTRQAYSVWDILVGSELMFMCGEQPALPVRFRNSRKRVTLRVTSFDEKAKTSVLKTLKVRNPESLVNSRQISQDIKEQYSFIKSVQTRSQQYIRKRPLNIIAGIVNLFKKAEAMEKCSYFTKDFYSSVLIDFELGITSEDFGRIWEYLTWDGSNDIHWEEFLFCIIGELDEENLFYVRKAFLKLDQTKSGEASVDNIYKFYRDIPEDWEMVPRLNVAGIPSLKDHFTSEKLISSRTSSRPASRQLQPIAWGDFCDYYFAVYLALDDKPELFLKYLRATWALT